MVAVAEGIESVDVLEAVRTLGADVGQGYLFSPAMPPASFEAWLTDRRQFESFMPRTPEADRRRQFRREDDRPVPDDLEDSRVG
jgi:predicted signal transduction protein with EAL and GGDEF domain